MIKVVVVDDSALARKLISGMLEGDPEIRVVGTAMNGVFGLRRIYRDRPDVVTMDFEMPQMDGLETLASIMERRPVPVIMLSAHTRAGAELTVKALELGAVDFVAKPDGRQSEVLGRLRRELVEKVKAAASAHVSRRGDVADGEREEDGPAARRPSPPEEPATPAAPKRARARPRPRPAEATPAGWPPEGLAAGLDLIAIGSSTGGVPGVDRILRSLPEDAPPTLVVQHMPATFTTSFAARLNGYAKVEVREAQGGEELRRGLALIARGDAHLGVARRGTSLVAEIGHGPKVSGHKPSVDHLFRSCARCLGPRCGAVILTGMGKDGAEGLLEIRRRGGRTIAESEASCVIYGMPKAAAQLGAAELVLPSDEIPAALMGAEPRDG